MSPRPLAVHGVRVPPSCQSEREAALLTPSCLEPNLGFPLNGSQSTPSVPYPSDPIWGALSVPRVPNGEPPPAPQQRPYQFPQLLFILAVPNENPPQLSQVPSVHRSPPVPSL